MRIRLLALTGTVIIVAADTVNAQAPSVSFSGGINLFNEFYSSSGIPARRSSNNSRLYFTPTITLFDQVQIPMEISVSTRQPDFRQPFNRFGINPNLFGWLTLHGGDFNAQISELTYGDLTLRGAGVEMRPGLLRLSLLFGKTQDALSPDSVNGVRGAFRRTLLAAKLGFGSEESFFIDLNYLHAVDDSTSLVNSPVDVAPKENSVISVGFGLPLLGEELKLRGEAAVAAYTDDIRSQRLQGVPGWVKSLFTSRTTSQVDGAMSLSLIVVPSRTFSVSLNTKWIGPGYITLGYAQLPNDVLDVTVSPSARFDNNKIAVRASVGVRFNNLRNDRLSTTRQTLASFGGTYQPSPRFGFDLQYANYGMSSTPRNDTLRLDNISQLVSVTPHYMFDSFGGMSTVALSYALQDFTDKNIITSKTNKLQTHSLTALWSLALPSTLSFTTSYTFVSSKNPALSTKIQSVNETVGHQFFDDVLTLSGTVGYNRIKVFSSDTQWTGGGSIAVRPKRWGTFTLTITTNRYDYGDPAAGVPYHELYGSLQYAYAF